jgi:hypothetical protein
MRTEAARLLGDPANEALTLAHNIEIRSKQGHFDEITSLPQTARRHHGGDRID